MDRVKGGRRKPKGAIPATIWLLVSAALLSCDARTGKSADSRAPGLTDPSSAAHVKFHSVGLAEAVWTHGFWADRFETCRANTLPALGKTMLADPSNPGPSQYLQNFR